MNLHFFKYPGNGRSSAMLLIMACTIFSCGDEEAPRLALTTEQAAIEQVQAQLLFQEVNDLTFLALAAPSDDDFQGGRKQTSITINDERYSCDALDITLSVEVGSLLTPTGIITVDFGEEGCTDDSGNTRRGKIKISYNGWPWTNSSLSITTTLENFSINGQTINGTITSTITADGDSWFLSTILSNGEIIFDDGRTVLQQFDIDWTVDEINDEAILLAGSYFQGTNSGGASYTAQVIKSVKYINNCRYPIEGTKVLNFSDVESTLDFGDGKCDNTATVTTSGTTTVINLD